MNDEISFEIMDRDTFTKDDIVGGASVRVSMLCANRGYQSWLPVTKHGRNAGELEI